MRTNAKIRKRPGIYESRGFKPCVASSGFGDTLLFLSSVQSMLCSMVVQQKAEAMHKIVAEAPVNSSLDCIIKIDKEIDNVSTDE